MNLLLDTQIFIWLTNERGRLSANTLTILEDLSNTRFLSMASVWEIQIKVTTGKLALPEPPEIFIPLQRRLASLTSLPILDHHIWSLAHLPLYHRDPFDRLLAAQAISENFILVSADPIFTQYPVKILQ